MKGMKEANERNEKLFLSIRTKLNHGKSRVNPETLLLKKDDSS